MLTKTKESEKMPAIVESLFRAREAELLERLGAVRESLQFITQNPKNIRFEVTLSSLWADEGEKNVTIKSKKGARLESVVKQAIAQFKQINKRNDVQAKWFVIAFAGTSALGILIPEEIIAPYRK